MACNVGIHANMNIYTIDTLVLLTELGMSTEIEYSGKYEYRNFFASKYG